MFFYLSFYYETLEPGSTLKFNWLDTFHLMSMLMVRILIISTKYGYYSPEHYKIVKEVRLCNVLAYFNLLTFVIKDVALDNLFKRVTLKIEDFGLNKADFFFNIEEE
jgi:hypothetical protein